MKRLVWFSLVVIIGIFPAQARVWYVAPDGTGDGSSWESPLGSLVSALTASTNGDDIWVKEGTYNEAITMKEGVALYGGFPTAGSPEWADRDWEANGTIIDASGLKTSVVVGANNATLDGFTVTGASASSSPA